MGLDTSHDCFHGAYSAFGRWREEVSKAAGFAVWPVKFEDATQNTAMIDWGHLPENALIGEWPETPNDPLLVLIAHSDCDGVIKPAQQLALANRLEELLPKLKELDSEAGGHIAARGGFSGVTEKFIAGLREAFAANEEVDFH